ncbi:Ni/Fe-hydrogenase cytochrome b subunit [Candidatus Poribacteria bacterium]|nr:Ni/Fe-hydrogenase cytochrome b subunit [Candidatus Poribacteria bacterium]
MRLRLVKGILWFFAGLAAVVTVFRFFKGLGAVTALTDTTPWGLWIGFDVLGGVALAAGGFVIAATVYIFHMEKYHAIVRPAVLTAFLGYAAVVGGLMFDIGIPWNIWRPMFFWQHHSALFEVAWCVMLYFTVLQLEFAPVVLERMKHPLLQTIYKIVKFSTLPLVILGIILSTLHQSSLGTLFLIMPYRVHPLWYSPILPILFYISAIGLGLSMVITESMVSTWLYKKHLEKDLLNGLGKTAAWVLGLYAFLKLGDLAVNNKLHYLFDGSWESNLFIFELLISAILPTIMFASPKIRQSTGGLATAAGLAVFGFVLNRIDVSGLSTIQATGSLYFPSWAEFAISIGIVSAAALAFFFFVENFFVYEEPCGEKAEKYDVPVADPVTGVRLSWSPLANARLYSLIFIVAVAFGFAMLPDYAVKGATPEKTPVNKARRVDGLQAKTENAALYSYAVFNPERGNNPENGEKIEMLLIDGDRKNKFVLFNHEGHQAKNGGKESCGICHHMNKPLDKASSCDECHRDMFVATDTFDHEFHRDKLKASGGCVKCHKDPAQSKNRLTTTPCKDCHKKMRAPNSFVKIAEKDQTGIAPGYMTAMHKLCVECHKQKQTEKPELAPHLARCGACHQGFEESMLTSLEPYPQEESGAL